MMLETQTLKPTHDGRRLKGRRTREEILSTAACMASQEGLEGLTIGKLARRTGMSKSGLFAHFGSKEDLQIAVTDYAASIFRERVIKPALHEDDPLAQLTAVTDGWVSYLEERVFPGGCFFGNASLEFGSRPGPVRDRLRYWMRQLTRHMEDLVEKARCQGRASPKADPVQLVFELHALVQEANYSFQLMDDKKAFQLARRGIRARLGQISTQDLENR
ncbi:MAG TPA: TetR/AcrR family transcriptional regulator [Acidobacteriota bacterium]|nr:TetR/AcrR family transcriptional regulator [Acidobacteriota bacterium]